jgi:hypothetical protein
MTQELNSPTITNIALPERSLRYMSSVVGKLPPMDTAPGAWFFSMDKGALDGYETYRIAQKSWDDRMTELLELSGLPPNTKYLSSVGHLVGLVPPKGLIDPPRWWRLTKKGHLQPRVRTKAEMNSEINKRFKALHDIPRAADHLPGMPSDVWTDNGVYPVHVRKPAQAVLVFLAQDPDHANPEFVVGSQWSRLKLSMFHSLKEYQAIWLPKN